MSSGGDQEVREETGVVCFVEAKLAWKTRFHTTYILEAELNYTSGLQDLCEMGTMCRLISRNTEQQNSHGWQKTADAGKTLSLYRNSSTVQPRRQYDNVHHRSSNQTQTPFCSATQKFESV